MDPILYFVVSIIVLFFSLPLLIFLNRKNSVYPLGRTGWPVLGENLEFLNTGRRGVPEKFITDRMQRFSSQVFRTSILGETTAVFCGPAGNKFLFTNENKLVAAWWPRSVHKIFPSSQQTSTIGEGALKMRKMLIDSLKPAALQNYVGIMDSIAKQHINSYWENYKQVMVYPLSKTYTFALSCKIFISVEDPAQLDKFSKPFVIVGRGILSIPLDLPGTAFRKAMKASNLIKNDLTKIIKQRKIDLAEGNASPTQDVLSHMLVTCGEDGNFMSDLEIAEKILGLLIAGHDTSSGAISFIVKYMAELPHIYDGVLREQLKIRDAMLGDLLTWEDIQKMKYSWNVACEAMRLSPPIPGTFREVLTEFSYNGFSIPKGWKLYWSTHSTHRDPAYFPSPENFDPSRFDGDGPIPYTYVPFGGGPRMCPGQEFARLEILIFLHNVVTKFKWKEVIPEETIIADPLPRPAKGLPVQLMPHIH